MRLTLIGQALIEHDLRTIDPNLFGTLHSHLSRGDVCFTNLEVTIRVDDPGDGRGTYFHAAPPEVIDCLEEMGVNLLAASNNHAWDMGKRGLRVTMEEVGKRGIPLAGVGQTAVEAAAPAYLKGADSTIAVVAMASNVRADSIATETSPGVSHLALDESGNPARGDAERILASIGRASEEADHVIVYQHSHYWEPDNRVTPDWQVEWAHRCIEAGGTVFVGQGVPRLHGIELYNGCPIFYCLGSFIFHTRTEVGHYEHDVWQSAIVHCEYDGGRLADIELIPLQLDEGKPGPRFLESRGFPAAADGRTAEGILERLQELSRGYGTTIEVEGSRGRILLA